MVHFILIYHPDSNMMISVLLVLSFVHCINVSGPIFTHFENYQCICPAKINDNISSLFVRLFIPQTSLIRILITGM